jgi:two-component system OmpR family sensor kinase/two-component system sensor histidine kinase BaeS
MRPPHHIGQHRPPWWPDGEPWPPTGPPPWAWPARRRRFIWRIGLLLVLFVVLAFGAFGLTFGLVSGGFHPYEGPRGPFFWGPGFGIFFLITAMFFVGRSLRRTAMPIADLMEAAAQIADGDYATRVPERGPLEVRQLASAFNSMAARLQATDQQRRGLLADVTHELRTPLTVIQGNLEGILDGIYPADEAHVAPILDETRVLSRLIDDLRTLSLAESGALQLQKEPTDLAALASETVSSFRAEADAAGITLDIESQPGLPPVLVDPARVRQVLDNLLSNALRHTPSGGTVQVHCSAGQDSVEIVVADTGAGIAPEDLPRIFDRFYRSGESKGMGLGLAIAKSLVEAHGGQIRAESETGRGTTVTVRLPASPSP